MHEAVISQKLAEEIEKECKKNKIKNLKEIIVNLGELTTYKKDPILFYFDIHKKNSKVLSNSELKIKETPGELMCNACKKKSKVIDASLIFCSECNSSDVKIIKGKEFFIEKIKGE